MIKKERTTPPYVGLRGRFGVVAKEESVKNESFSAGNWKLKNENWKLLKEHPHYTRPEVFILNGKKFRVPLVLLSGNHKKIDEWRKKYSK